MRRISVDSMPPRSLPHRHRIPPRGFDQNVPRLLSDHGVEPAHHASEPHGLLRISHDKIVGGKRSLHTIERLQFLAVFRFSNDEPSTFEQVHIKDVRRLAHFPENIVGSIDSIADEPLIQQLQPVRDLLWRWLDRCRTYNPRRESRTKLRLLDRDTETGRIVGDAALQCYGRVHRIG